MLYGKPLGFLILKALNSLYLDNKETVSVREITEKILIQKPELKELVNDFQKYQNFKKRVFNHLINLNKSEFIQMEIKTNKAVNQTYYLIFTKQL